MADEESSGEELGWTEEDSREFIRYAESFTPFAEAQIDILSRLIGRSLPSEAHGEVVDLCCGDGRLAEAILRKYPRARVRALDRSKEMLEETSRRCADYKDRLSPAYFDLESRNWRKITPRPNAILSSLAVHHLSAPSKKRLISDVYEALAENGAFVLADIIRPASEVGFAIAADQWDDWVSGQTVKDNPSVDVAAKFRELEWNYFRNSDGDPVDQPSPIQDHLDWFRQAGFVDVDVHFLYAGHAIISGYRR